MKKTICLLLSGVSCLSLCGCARTGAGLVWTVLLVVAFVLLLGVAALRTSQYLQYRRRRMAAGKKYKSLDMLTLVCYALALVALIVALILPGGNKPEKEPEPSQTQGTTEPTEPPLVFAPTSTDESDPGHWNVTWEIYKDGVKVDSYQRLQTISFGDPQDYFALPGIATFRGNNYRNATTYGMADVVNQSLTTLWTVETGTLEGGVWSGSGWTGQPLLVQWDEETKAVMNLYPEKKTKHQLVEVIYATLDGNIYFLDLDDGSATRDPISLGMCFKGAGALDPRGYPIMYVGSGDVNYYGERPHAYILSLIDGSILYEFGKDDPLALRKDNNNWTAFDSSPLVDAETDTLIWPGENGILYTMKLNTHYDPAAGTVSVAPSDHVVTRYTTASSTEEKYWLGYEASASVCEGYLYISENGGLFYCVDLNTMDLVWVQDTCDDSNGSPVFERTGIDGGYVYTAPSLHWTQDDNAQGQIRIYKLDAIDGEVLWSMPYNVHTVSGVSGGVQSTMLLDSENERIYCTISRTPDVQSGLLVALDTETGQELWRLDMTNYAWSSPVAIHGVDGTEYLAVADSMGYLFLLDAASGTVRQTIELGGLVEATPAVYGDKLVVGTRNEKIVCVQIG